MCFATSYAAVPYRANVLFQHSVAVQGETAMNGWSPEDAMAMERRHIVEGKKRVARQEALVRSLIEKRLDRIVPRSKELLGFLRDSLELSKERLRDLEDRYSKMPSERHD